VVSQGLMPDDFGWKSGIGQHLQMMAKCNGAVHEILAV
jgi:hypothetical protein